MKLRFDPWDVGWHIGDAHEPRGSELWVPWDRTAGVIGPQGSGKTLDLLTPALLGAPGAALVTLTKVEDLDELVVRVNERTAMLWVDGHSDYGHAFRTLADGAAGGFGGRSSVLVLGDARNNYHAAAADALAALASRVRHVFWLNPEPRAGWDTGDSIVSDYGVHCDGVYECRNLRQLERFVETLD